MNEARAFAVRRVESTVRHLRNMTTKSSPQHQPVNGANDGEKTQRFTLAPPRPEVVEPPAAPESAEISEPPTAALPVPSFSLADELESWEPTTDAVAHEAVIAVPESLEPAEFAAPSPFDSGDTEVLEALSNLLREISPPTAPAVEPTPPAPVVAERPIDGTETMRPPMPQPPSEPEHERLERLLKFVARQEPGLRWAIGNRDDGTTLLVSDLAHGWIPPGITLPAEVHLLEPARRKGTATALLGTTTLSATYAPGDPLGWATDYDVTDTSWQPRELPAVDDLGWVLSEATHWRDGLPRLVNTLAKAGAAGTGIVDAEIDILRVYMDTSRYQLLAQYPDIDAGLLLNCLLLAATEGIATKNQVSANYHFAWFHMLNAPPASGWKAGA